MVHWFSRHIADQIGKRHPPSCREQRVFIAAVHVVADEGQVSKVEVMKRKVISAEVEHWHSRKLVGAGDTRNCNAICAQPLIFCFFKTTMSSIDATLLLSVAECLVDGYRENPSENMIECSRDVHFSYCNQKSGWFVIQTYKHDEVINSIDPACPSQAAKASSFKNGHSHELPLQ